MNEQIQVTLELSYYDLLFIRVRNVNIGVFTLSHFGKPPCRCLRLDPISLYSGVDNQPGLPPG